MHANDAPPRGRRIVSVAAAIVAVLAALGTLYSHHRSIMALSAKNQAILTQARATDTYNAYEAKQIRYNVYRAVLASDLVRNAKNRAALEAIAENEQNASPAVLAKAKALEGQALRDDDRSESIMRSYELLQYATTMFEISIVLISLSALASPRMFLPVASALSCVGLVLFFVGLLKAH